MTTTSQPSAAAARLRCRACRWTGSASMETARWRASATLASSRLHPRHQDPRRAGAASRPRREQRRRSPPPPSHGRSTERHRHAHDGRADRGADEATVIVAEVRRLATAGGASIGQRPLVERDHEQVRILLGRERRDSAGPSRAVNAALRAGLRRPLRNAAQAAAMGFSAAVPAAGWDHPGDHELTPDSAAIASAEADRRRKRRRCGRDRDHASRAHVRRAPAVPRRRHPDAKHRRLGRAQLRSRLDPEVVDQPPARAAE